MASSSAVNETTAQGIEITKNKENNIEVIDIVVCETIHARSQEQNLVAAQDPFQDSGFFESEHFQADVHETNNYDNPTEPYDIDLDLDFILADYFKDTASTETSGVKNDTNKSTVIPNDLFHGYHDISNPRANSAYKAILDFENHTKSETSDLCDEFTTPLQEYARTYERHESIAYRLEKQNPVCVSYKRSTDSPFSEPAKKRKTQQ